MLSWFKKRGQGAADPIAAYDGLLEDLERQAGQTRRSAATLLCLRGELERDLERQRRLVAETRGRLGAARSQNDARAVSVLVRDVRLAQERLDAAEGALHSAQDDARLLLTAAQELSEQIDELKTERSSAVARLRAGREVSAAMRQTSEKLQRLLALDAARDEVERAHALAEIYREETKKR